MKSSKIISLDFEPESIPITTKKFVFNYIEADTNIKRKYKISAIPNHLYSFHMFIFNLLEAKRKLINPWIINKNVKKNVKIEHYD